MKKMPVLFIGHGSPMNAIEANKFTSEWVKLAAELPKPKAVLCISAHWHSNHMTEITASEKLATIYDFGGFPAKLHETEYTPPGDSNLCRHIVRMVNLTPIRLNYSYGIDHGCWSILKHMYPDAKTKVLQLSIDSSKSPQWHFNLGAQLKELRKEGVLVLGSGNIVHNLRHLDWNNQARGYEWAETASAKIKQLILNLDFSALTDYTKLGEDIVLAIPSPDHYLPLMYILGLMDDDDTISLFNDELIMGSLSMTSLKIS